MKLPDAALGGHRSALVEGLLVAALVTGAVSLASMFVPEKHVATAVGFIFLATTWALVWRRDDAVVERSGLSFGGLVLPGKIDGLRAFRSALIALAWALAFAAITFAPFYLGWHWWWHPTMKFAIDVKPLSFANDAAGQLLMIALPEESFYRGYLQSRLDDAFAVR